ncbi:toll/interleukin-1 receptor domain-containing protein [Roseivirga pacifica]|uniref:toll/interleukin-1 receptor domain-containing protein n=1 Tax=Roseivirga pacifica TaxID=1267423 RepID=UPI003BB1EBE6
MQYNIYIKTQSRSSNILNVDEEELGIVVDAYNSGKEDFFIAGKKYWLKRLFEIKVFTFPSGKLDEFLKLAEERELYELQYMGNPYLPPSTLKQAGEEVTKEYIKGDFGYLAEEYVKPKARIDMDIFISHSSSDIEIAKHLIQIIRKAFNIETKRIRCTSVPGHKLKAGANTDDQLKKEIFTSKAFIGVITKESINSTYVLFELGARWGVGLPLIPLICDQAGTSLLSGPIKNINALSAIDSSDMLQFLSDLGDILNLKSEDPSGYIQDIEKLKAAIVGSQQEDNIDKPTVNIEYLDADELIKKQSEIEWPDDYEMRVHFIESQRKAVEDLKKGKPDDLTNEEFSRIRERAKNEWPLDFEMRYETEQTQVDALRKLKNI